MDMDTLECTVTDLSDSFKPIQIPPDASYLGEFYLGSSGIFDGSVLIQQWVGNITNPPGMPVSGRTTAYISFTLQVNIQFK